MRVLDAERLRFLLRYDPETGHFYRERVLRNGGGQKVGDRAGHVSHALGYVVMSVDGSRYYAHRLAFLYMEGAYPKEVDHKNGVRHDNRWVNLRRCSSAQNKANRAVDARNKFGLKGVRLLPSGKYRGEIRANKKTVHLGVFDTPEEAHAVYVKAAGVAFGEFANAGEFRQ